MFLWSLSYKFVQVPLCEGAKQSVAVTGALVISSLVAYTNLLGVTVVFEACLGLIPGIHGTWVKVVSAESLQSKLKTLRVAPGRIEEQVLTS